MRLSSPANQLVSLHPDHSIVGPIEDSKAAAGFAQGVHLYSMASPLEKGHRDPRSSYSTAFYPDPKLLAYSSPKTTASRTTPRTQTNQTQSGDEATSEGEAAKSSIGDRKRKLSWPPGDRDMEYKSASPSDRRNSRFKEEEADFKDVQMNPPSSQHATSSGLVASERLPGIAHFDEQMNSPWSIEAARRNANFRSSGGEESLRRLSGQTFNSPAEGRPWRFSMQESSIQLPHRGEYHSPSQGADTFRRPSSPSANRYYQRGGGNSVDRMMVYRGASPSMEGGSALYSRQHGLDRDVSPSHRPPFREWNEGAPQLPLAKSQSEDRRRHSTMLGGFGSRDHLTSNERAPLDRRGMDLGSGTSTPTFGSVAMHSRQSESVLPSMQSSFSYDSQNGPGGLERNSFDSRSYERGDSPSYYADDTRIDESSPRHHPYGMSGAGASPNAPRRRGKLPKAVTDLLKSWLLDHSSHPYPTEDEKRRLCSVTGLSISQVSNWFINARRRILVPQGSGSFGIGPPQQVGPGHEGAMSSGPRHPGPPMHHQHGPPPPHHLSSRYSPPLSSNHHQQQPPPQYSMQQPYQHHRAPPAHLPPLHQLHSRSSHSAPYQHHQHSFERPGNHHEEAESHTSSSQAYSKRESSHSPRNTSGPSFAEGQRQ